ILLKCLYAFIYDFFQSLNFINIILKTMADKNSFLQVIEKGYSFKGESVRIGIGMLDGEIVEGATINLPLKTMNRHGLVAGATGTGKTKTLQILSEVLSDASVPVLIMDIKGDLSGIAAPGESNQKIIDRSSKIGVDYKPSAYPVELLTLSEEKGVRLRATVSEFGPRSEERRVGKECRARSWTNAV